MISVQPSIRSSWFGKCALTLLIGVWLNACSGGPSEPNDIVTLTFDFDREPYGFTAGFADYPPAQASRYELTSDYRALPPPLESRSGLYIAGFNLSSDLFMFFKGSIGGLPPGARYGVSASVEIATNVPAGCVGVGSPPGEGVWIKAGASAAEPLPLRRGTQLRMNIDIGNQAHSGTEAVVLGNIANSRVCEQPQQWELKSFEAKSIPAPISVPSDGRIWLIFGSDSGLQSRTEVYITRAVVTFTPVP